MPYEETTHTHSQPGDTLVLYSDGVTDAHNAADEEFGEARLHDLLRSLAGQPATVIVDRVLGALEAYVEDTPQFDDMTILVARRLPQGVDQTQPGPFGTDAVGSVWN